MNDARLIAATGFRCDRARPVRQDDTELARPGNLARGIVIIVRQHRFLAPAALPAMLMASGVAQAQSTDAPVAPSNKTVPAAPAQNDPSARLATRTPNPIDLTADATQDDPGKDDQVTFSADGLQYDNENNLVTATGDVRMRRSGNRLRADKIVWNRKTGQVVASGNVVVTNPSGDAAYGSAVELTDALKDGVIDNMLVVLDQGGRLAANRGTRHADGVISLDDAAYSPCNVVDSSNCPKLPSWHITALQVVYNPERHRIYYKGARLNLFGLPTIPLPAFSNPVGLGAQSGFLTPDVRYGRTNGFELAAPYYFRLAPNRGLVVTPRLYSNALPAVQLQYDALTSIGAYRVIAYATSSQRTDPTTGAISSTNDVFRGYLDIAGRFQLSPEWSVSTSVRLTTDLTFLRRYDISRDDLLRNTLNIEHITDDSYLSIAGWAIQTLRVGDRQGLQPFALPEIDYRRRFGGGLPGSVLQVQLNTLALDRTAGQDTQRAFASAEWNLRRITPWGQEVTLTAYGRGDLYRANDTIATTIDAYRGQEGVHGRAIGAVALDVAWPLIGSLFGGSQRLTPRIQFVGSPHIANLLVPNEDARSVDLDDTNLFSLNRFPGYDRFDDASRVTYGFDWAVNVPNISINATIGQSYQFSKPSDLVPVGTGFSERLSDIVGRTEVRFKDFVSLTHRYRLDKGSLAVRRNEIDATIGSHSTYFLVGYLRLNRNITPTLEDLRNREEARVGGRLQLARFWSVFGSGVVDLTDRREDSLSLSDGFTPIRHRLGFAYEDDCLRLGLTWKRDYQDTGDARRGDSFLLTLAFKNLGR